MNTTPVVIVTGASRGIGAAVAQRLAGAGAALTLIARSRQKLETVAAGLQRNGGGPLVCQADVTEYMACQEVVDQTLEHFGRIDALVNNAGIVQPIDIVARADPADWRYCIEVNLIGPFNLARACLAALRGSRGRVVNVSSGAAILALETVSAYCAAKAGLNQFTRVLAAEEPAVTVLAVRPGVVDTDMQAVIRREGARAMTAEQAAYYRRLKADGRLAAPAVPARVIAWLALHAPREFSGKFLDYDDPQIRRASRNAFGRQRF